ncbi:MAG: DUF1622 domain-containing protein [Cyanobacteria bacterium P01_D01_bin.56]
MSLTLFSEHTHSIIQAFDGLLISLCQLMAILVIAIGVLRAFAIFLRNILLQQQTYDTFQTSRLAMGYTFSLGLSFLIGASILTTIISSQWNDIAQLVVVIGIRTALNLLLERANRVGQL